MKCSAAEVIVAGRIEPRLWPAETKSPSAEIDFLRFWPMDYGSGA
jgi:hypothetical protein